ncbi:unnamed protein product [Allacma fusca]|uniref:Peptidase S1 domain-containing protein n=1 Tax=Allacma fusca TaxID=39272 RepID=A0A8J2KAG3_9HEXA|nr:unnamed protein product [Allacma fusca]
MIPLQIVLAFASLPFLICAGAPNTLRRYKVCNGIRCRSVRSFVSPEFLLDMDSFLYTGWSRWSPCSRKCATHRYRACRFPSICGDRMTIHEEAFCFRRGTHCEYIFYNSRQDFNPDDSEDHDRSDWGYETHAPSAESSGSRHSSPVSFNPIMNQRQNETTLHNRRKYVTVFGSTTKIPPVSRNQIGGTTEVSDSYFSRNKSSRKREDQAGRRTEQDMPKCGVARVKDNDGQGLMLRILGGSEAQKGRWPWQVAVLNRMQEAFCGGTLIAPRWILTAAHCVRRRIHVTIGEHNLHKNEGTEKHYRIDSAFIHPDFDPETVNNDIALLLLPEPVSIKAGLACLPQQQQVLPSPDTLCTILGWGKERHNHIFGTTVLHEGKVPIVNNAECRYTYPYEITSNMFCAGYKGGLVDSCAGDSGGPILCSINNRWTIFGVTSFGDGCGRKGKYGIYAKVPNYVEWIKKIMQANEHV